MCIYICTIIHTHIQTGTYIYICMYLDAKDGKAMSFLSMYLHIYA